MGGCESKEIGDESEISIDDYETTDPLSNDPTFRFLESI